MAQVKAPFLCLGASGKLAGTLVATTWKGIKVLREYVIPANPQTADQVTQRGIFTDAVAAYRNYLTNAEVRGSWDRKALYSGTPMSGFNACMRALCNILTGNADASFNGSTVEGAVGVVAFTMKNMDDGATGDEAGNFEVWVGDNPGSLLLFETKAIAVGVITTSKVGDTAEVKYVELRKDSESRSGIFKATCL